MINYQKLSVEFGIKISKIKAIKLVESSGNGFDEKTGKIKIQFEPSYFKRLANIVIDNGVEVQSKEWAAFNLAFSKNPNKAMESTSWGCMQVMGEHWKRLGFESVGKMVDFAKESEYNQLWLGLKFICTSVPLKRAVDAWDCKEVARMYNGKNYWIKGYHTKLEQAEIKFRIL